LIMVFHNLQDDQVYRNKTSAKLVGVVILCFTILLIRLYVLQVSQYDYHLRLSEENRIRLKIIDGPRGLMLDRNYNILVRNRPSYQISIMPTELVDKAMVFANLMKIKNSSGVSVFDSLKVEYMMQRGRWRKFEALPILEDASLEMVSIIEEHQLELPGVITVVESRREYPFGPIAAHALGYTAEIAQKEFDAYKERGYRLGNRVGAKGLEKYYENILRGKEGKQFVEVNAYGKEVGVLDNKSNVPARPGKNIIITLDIDLQLVAEQAVSDTVKAAVVAIDPRNGEILVMLSSPRINGNIFSLSKKKRSREWAKLALNSRRPLNNRAVIGVYDPGSTFKAITSIASFKSGLVGYKDKFKSCRGGYRIGRRFQKCWKASGHGKLDFLHAFKQSCDTYYYQVGLKIGMDPINTTAANFGFGKKTGVDLVSERSGLLMDSVKFEIKFRKRGWKWTRGLILNLAIGQGQLVTPLQLANYAAGLGNGEIIYRPHFLKEVQDEKGGVLERFEPETIGIIDLTTEQHQEVLEAMRHVVMEPGGTGGRARVKGVIVGGKTGSAQNTTGIKTHALFICVAPLYNPEIAIAVVVENMGHGGSIAAPIAQKILQKYFDKKNGKHS